MVLNRMRAPDWTVGSSTICRFTFTGLWPREGNGVGRLWYCTPCISHPAEIMGMNVNCCDGTTRTGVGFLSNMAGVS